MCQFANVLMCQCVNLPITYQSWDADIIMQIFHCVVNLHKLQSPPAYRHAAPNLITKEVGAGRYGFFSPRTPPTLTLLFFFPAILSFPRRREPLHAARMFLPPSTEPKIKTSVQREAVPASAGMTGSPGVKKWVWVCVWRGICLEIPFQNG